MTTSRADLSSNWRVKGDTPPPRSQPMIPRSRAPSLGTGPSRQGRRTFSQHHNRSTQKHDREWSHRELGDHLGAWNVKSSHSFWVKRDVRTSDAFGSDTSAEGSPRQEETPLFEYETVRVNAEEALREPQELVAVVNYRGANPEPVTGNPDLPPERYEIWTRNHRGDVQHHFTETPEKALPLFTYSRSRRSDRHYDQTGNASFVQAGMFRIESIETVPGGSRAVVAFLQARESSRKDRCRLEWRHLLNSNWLRVILVRAEGGQPEEQGRL